MSGLTEARSLEELQQKAELDKKTAISLKSKSCANIFKLIQNIVAKAEIAAREGDHSTAYVLYMRAGTLCALIQKSPEKTTFSNSPDGRHFSTIFLTIIENADNLSKTLKNYFSDCKAAEQLHRDIQAESTKEENIKRHDNVSPIDAVKDQITPKQIIDFAKQGYRILIMDYRPQTNVQIDFKAHSDGQNVVIALCPPNCIENSITLVHLSKVIPIKERQKVDKSEMEKYDLVVFMDEENPKVDKQGKLLPPASHLLKGLTEYAYNNPLKRSPVFMKGGFKMWAFTYQIYTNQEQTKSLFSDDDEFGKILSGVKRISINVDYPDLMKRVAEPPWPTSTGEVSLPPSVTTPPQKPDEVKWRAQPQPGFPTLQNHQQPLPSQPPRPPPPAISATTPKPSTITSFGIGDNEAPTSRPALPDRSTKPTTSSSQSSHVSPPTFTGTASNAAAEPYHSQPKQQSYPIGPKQLNGAINGDAHVDRYPNAIGFVPPPPKKLTTGPIPDVPRRPPTPERPAKVPEMSHEAQRSLLMVYQKSYGTMQQDGTPARSRSFVGVGFVNMGNTCFMNTTLQAVINTPGMKKFFRRENFLRIINECNRSGTPGVITSVFTALMDLYWSQSVTVIRPEIFLKTFASEVNRQLADQRQHDAQEFQIYLLDALHEDTNRVRIPKSFEQNYDATDLVAQALDYERKSRYFASSPINDLFNIRTVSIITCNYCGTSSATFEELSQIALELTNHPSQMLHDCLRKHFGRDTLQNDCAWNCPKCRVPRDAIRETFIWKLPPTLVIHLKRFSQSGGYDYVKNDAVVYFDDSLSMLEKCMHRAAPRANALYSLYAVTNHMGSLNSGHYTSYIRREQRWFKFDDEDVAEVSRDAIRTNKAFVLFYSMAQ